MGEKMKYYTVNEVKEILGISSQAIYKSMNEGRLKPYRKIYKGNKLISQQGLLIEYGVANSTLMENFFDFGIEIKSDKREENQPDQPEQLEKIAKVDSEVENATQTNPNGQLLQHTIRMMEKTIDTLQKQLEEKDEEIKRLHKVIMREQDLANEIQVKLGQEQELQLRLQGLIETKEEQEEQPKRRGIFGRKKKSE